MRKRKKNDGKNDTGNFLYDLITLVVSEIQ